MPQQNEWQQVLPNIDIWSRIIDPMHSIVIIPEEDDHDRLTFKATLYQGRRSVFHASYTSVEDAKNLSQVELLTSAYGALYSVPVVVKRFTPIDGHLTCEIREMDALAFQYFLKPRLDHLYEREMSFSEYRAEHPEVTHYLMVARPSQTPCGSCEIKDFGSLDDLTEQAQQLCDAR